MALKLATSLKPKEPLPNVNVNVVQLPTPHNQIYEAPELEESPKYTEETPKQPEVSDSCLHDKITEEPTDTAEQTVNEFFNSE